MDVDTHWEISRFVPGDHPLEPWLGRVWRDRVEQLAHGIAGDLLDALPPQRRPSGRTLLPGLVELAEQRGGPVVLHPEHDSTAAERVAWMDRVGIDHCLVNPGAYAQPLQFLGPDRRIGASRCNDFLAEQLARPRRPPARRRPARPLRSARCRTGVGTRPQPRPPSLPPLHSQRPPTRFHPARPPGLGRPASGGDMLRRNVRFTPLPGFGDTEALDVLTQYPQMGMFSSDYPHMEGNADPINLYGRPLHDLAPDVRARFLGGNAQDTFARTGNPL